MITPLVNEVPVTGATSWAWLMIVIPLVTSGFLLVAGRRTDKWGHWLAVLASWCSFGIGLVAFIEMLQRPAEQRAVSYTLYQLIPGGESGLEVNVGLLLDPLSMTFVMLVTFVGSLIHVYAVAYMEHDSDRRRFFAYLNFFVASMLTLVMADSYALLFFGWEGVGLASYLLIGFWNFVPEYASAAKKAFVMNRVGDLGLLLAMMTMFLALGSVSFSDVLDFASSKQMSVPVATTIGLFLLVAACGKSAQFPLQAWLGDAMAGPTPVSALIHAATMVTAGVYLMVRSGAIYQVSLTAQMAVAIIGAITLMFGAIVGCAKDDFKKVLAASTMSQIGYMMLGAGLGPIGWTFAIFHLLSHGFFKAQLFLGAGSVMHGMNDQVNMRRFGGLSKYMKITWITFGIGWWAILGLPPFSGYFTKDPIIEAAFMPVGPGGVTGAWIFGLVATIGAAITAFYMSRLFFMTFHGKPRWTTKEEGAEQHPHESSPLMTVPLLVLSVFSIGLGGVLGATGWFQTWLEPVVGHAEHVDPVLPVMVIKITVIVLVILGVALAWKLYVKDPVPTYPPSANALVRAARRDLYQDDFNHKAFVIPSTALMNGVTAADKHVVDGAVRGIGKGTVGLGTIVSKTQNGMIRTYAAYTLGGVIVALALVLGMMM